MSASQNKLNEAMLLLQQGHLAQAKTVYEEILAAEPQQVDALHLLGVIAIAEKDYQRAAQLIKKAIAIDSHQAAFYCNLGNALTELYQLEEAVDSFDQAIVIKPDYAMAYSNRGLALQSLKQLDKAVASFDRAIALKPDYVTAYSNRGNALQDLHQYEAAIESYNCAIRFKPDFAESYLNRGNAQQALNRLEEAVASFGQAIMLKPDLAFLPGTLLHTKMKLCDWAGLREDIATLIEKIKRGEKASSGYAMLALTNSLSVMRQATATYAKYTRPFNHSLGEIPARTKPGKIRVGYFSADFRTHALLFLMAELFERHDKNRFEIIAFSFGPNTQDELRKRVEKAFDRFIDVCNYSDKEVAVLARELSIDIAVDLGGDTSYSRSAIFSYRAAPIQINYLGYPGTMGADYYDYLVADHTIITQESQPYYVEKIVYLPNSYQVNDSTRKIADKVFTREECGLPEQGFVFCCFNNNHKITPDTFDSWMRILKAATGSVLFLFADNKIAEQNLRTEARARGVDANRLVFAARIGSRDYLARLRVADLFLNTFPFDAGTTASDALWAGVPVLTRLGETFVSRVAASLLNAIGLPELITPSQENYEALAIELAMHPDKIKTIKEKLAANRLTTPLFNTVLFTKHLEEAYTQMADRYYAGLMPDHIYVKQIG